MNITRLKTQHRQIIEEIDRLRRLSKDGPVKNAVQLATGVEKLGRIVTQHLAIEDRILYPRLQDGPDETLQQLGQRFQSEMADVASPFIFFSKKWQVAAEIQDDPDGFRQDANTVLRKVYERLREEDRDFYPVVEASQSV